MVEQKIPCPICSTQIPFDTRQLLAGIQFTCPKCGASIGLANESKPLVEETIKKLETLKNVSSKKAMHD